MDVTEAERRLRSLSADAQVRSKIAQVRDVFPAVEAALLAGVSRSAVLAEFAKLGLTLKPQTFNVFVSRLRKERGRASDLAQTDAQRTEGNDGQQRPSLAAMPVRGDPPRATLNEVLRSTPDVDAMSAEWRRAQRMKRQQLR